MLGRYGISCPNARQVRTINIKKSMKIDDKLTSEPIPKLVRQIAAPASIGFFFNTMFNVVDTYFAGLISTQALAGLSVSFPIFFIIIALGAGLSTGLTAVLATLLGEGRFEHAKLVALHGIIYGVLLSFFIGAFGVAISPVLFTALGASEDYLAISIEYMSTIFYGAPLFLLLYMLNAVLNAHGDTKPFRNYLIAGFFLNVLLDPWFIYGGFGVPPLGVRGIALATVLAQLVGCIYLGAKVSSAGLVSGMSGSKVVRVRQSITEISHQGFPASLNNMTVGIGIFIITFFLGRFGKEAVAAYGIATRVEQIILLPAFGLNIATLTLVAQNNGAMQYERVFASLQTALRYGITLMAFGNLGLVIFPAQLVALFSSDPAVISIGVGYLRMAAFLLYAYVILYVHVAALQGMKRPLFALWIGLFRQIVAPIGLFYVATSIYHFGLHSVWWGIFCINWIAALITVLYARNLLGRIGCRPAILSIGQ